MNTRGGTVGTATPRSTRHTHALPTAAGHRQWKGTLPSRKTLQEPKGRCRRYAMTHRPPADRETTRHPLDCLVSPEASTMDVKPAAAGPAINCDDPRQADPARESPLPQPDNA